jgi:hypothetical protein
MSALWGEAEGADRQTPLNSVANDPCATLALQYCCAAQGRLFNDVVGCRSAHQDLPTVEKIPPPAFTATIHDDAVTAAQDAGYHATAHAGRKAREHRRVIRTRF